MRGTTDLLLTFLLREERRTQVKEVEERSRKTDLLRERVEEGGREGKRRRKGMEKGGRGA